MQVFAKFLIVCEKYTILNHLIALEHTATKPFVFSLQITLHISGHEEGIL